ncbi:TATA-binding protein-associated factor TAF11 KNAG_0C03130 [Huiozyma naganishii CBS 8797]|uniref:TAFII28-like protein domain-containing protein n=1 Tax=Huiozyma naganishii (strain ATCC MYA-139 / BCRC 22969 / CBS 8797 / KCTC 17520 / NBRC 10181 / NCYC 3082 / Yp74L-3) TaxID=1071383 RepID=J7S4R1_HUIN7|nr:hypothetical protein KNAG_0C03130 [Kazachstania naganishii CBS 8797]CCK69424.1 hypothetical protein KNAG_0C03130 [Kazachstania naganishii CBS 8797]
MTDAPQGPLDTIPEVNYAPIVTVANYFATKQMIDQILSEDQEYVSWKVKDLRTGGTMNSFLPSDIGRLDYSSLPIMDKDEEVNRVPDNLTFVPDVYRDQLSKEVAQEAEAPLEELSYEDQFKLLIMNLDSEQTDRFEIFHRTALHKGQIKKLATMVCRQNIGENIRVFLQAIGKIFAGEIIELALEVRRKWLVGQMVCEFDRRKMLAWRLKKYLKKLTCFCEGGSDEVTGDAATKQYNKRDTDGTVILGDDSVDEFEPDEYFDDEEDDARATLEGNKLLATEENTRSSRAGLISHYNELVKSFNSLDVSMEKYNSSPLLPEHVREAWRLYLLQNETYKLGSWRAQGEPRARCLGEPALSMGKDGGGVSPLCAQYDVVCLHDLQFLQFVKELECCYSFLLLIGYFLL